MSENYFKRAVDEIINEYNLDIWLLVFILLFGIYQFVIVPIIFVNSTDAVIDGKLINTTTRVGGIVSECYITKDQEVKKGDLLAQIDPSEYQNELIKLETNIELNREKLKILKTEPKPEDKNITNNEEPTVIEINPNSPKYKNVAKDITKYAKTYEPEDVAETNLARKKIAMGEALKTITQINEDEAKKKNIQQPLIDKSSITITNETVDSVEKELKYLENRKEEIKLMIYSTKIFAPRDGTISSVSVKQGDIINPSDVICSIIPKQVWVIARVAPENLAKIKIGQDVTIKIPNHKYRNFKGVITSVDKTAKVYKINAKSQITQYDDFGNQINTQSPIYQIKIDFIEDYSDFNLTPDTQVKARILVNF